MLLRRSIWCGTKMGPCRVCARYVKLFCGSKSCLQTGIKASKAAKIACPHSGVRDFGTAWA